MKRRGGNSIILLAFLVLLSGIGVPRFVPASVTGEIAETDGGDMEVIMDEDYASEPDEMELEEDAAEDSGEVVSEESVREDPEKDTLNIESDMESDTSTPEADEDEIPHEEENQADDDSSAGVENEVPEDEMESQEESQWEDNESSDVEQPEPEEEHRDDFLTGDQLGNWTSYNGVIFGDASIYQSQSGGGLAVGGALSIHNSYRVGSTYTSLYDPTIHIGEYKNEDGNPALLLGGDTLDIDDSVIDPDVYGGVIAMSPELMEQNSQQQNGFLPGTDAFYQPVEQQVLEDWFSWQYKIAQASSELMLLGNDVSIDIAMLSDGSYLEAGPDAYRNRFFEVDGEIYENALFITVNTDRDLNFGQWWPVHSILYLDVNWAMESDLMVFNFPDAVNVTMNSSAFQIAHMQHWSTTVDAWVGERGMQERLALAERVVYNFPKARSIETNQALIQGTILAPNASFTGVGFGDAGHIYGHIVAKSFVARGNFTIHAFALTSHVYDIVEDALSGRREHGAISLRHYLYFQEETTSIRTQGGEFLLEDENGRYFDGDGGFVTQVDHAAVYTTTAEGYTEIRNVPLGDYTLVKQSPPEGFVLNDSDPDNSYTYWRFPVAISTAGQTARAVRYSEPLFTDLYFRKTDAETGEGLPGAVFTIVREEDEFQDSTVGGTYTSGQDGIFVSAHIPVGTYHLVETEPPPGYGLVEGGEISFSVFWDEETQRLAVHSQDGAVLSATRDNPMEIPNLAGGVGNTLMLIKYTEEPDDPGTFFTLPNARLALYRHGADADRWELMEQNATGKEIRIVTNEYGYCRVDDLPQGTYRLVETQAPAGYTSANRYTDDAHEDIFPTGYVREFTFSETASFLTAYVADNPLEVDVTVSVSGLLLEEMRPTPGASLRLEHLLNDQQTWEEWIGSADTDENGELHLGGLTKGTYRLTQLQAAGGFRRADPSVIRFTIVFDGEGAPSLEAMYDGQAVGTDTDPVWVEEDAGFRIHIRNEANACDYLVYKIDGDYTTGTNEEGNPFYQVTYLENAEFRLRRRPGARNIWEDYGAAFVSELQYTSNEEPVMDSYGNHIAAAAFQGGLIPGEYQLVETRSPDGFQTGSDAEVILGDGTVGHQIHRFTITDEMVAAGRRSTYTAVNYADHYSMAFRFRLVDRDNPDKVLSGAKFALFHCEKRHIHDLSLTAESCWAQSTPVILTGNANGIVSLENLVTGAYLLREEKAPAGYHLPGALWMITVDAQKGTADTELVQGMASDAFVSVDNGTEWLLRNRKSLALPVTGGRGTRYLKVWGILLVGVAIALKRIKSGHRKDKK